MGWEAFGGEFLWYLAMRAMILMSVCDRPKMSLCWMMYCECLWCDESEMNPPHS